MSPFHHCALLLLALFPSVYSLSAVASYSNVWIDPHYILARRFANETGAAQNTVGEWATLLASEGPWSVLNKQVIAPSGDPHDYMSWAPYSWPNCTGVGNTTELTPEEVWVTCPYYQRDGEFNPDGRLINNIGQFTDLADAVLYNTLTWVITGYTPAYSENAVKFIQAWFLDEKTKMNPNLKYSQMKRGPEGQLGAHTGVLDLKCMTKIVNAIVILRKANSTDWTSEIDAAMVAWTETYIHWLETWPTAIIESETNNNHGSFYFSQFAALKILVGDLDGARQAIQKYFTTTWQLQIWKNGEQPFEMIRTRPYHYRAYNLDAMITNARLGQYLGFNAWNLTTKNGSTIQNACDFAMTIPPGKEAAGELFPNVADIGSTYGDPDGKYAAFLAARQPTYGENPYFLWAQPFSDSDLMASRTSSAQANVTSPPTPVNTSTDAAGRTEMGLLQTSFLLFMVALFSVCPNFMRIFSRHSHGVDLATCRLAHIPTNLI